MNKDLFKLIHSMRNESNSWKEIYKKLTYSSMNSMKFAYNRKKFYQQKNIEEKQSNKEVSQ